MATTTDRMDPLDLSERKLVKPVDRWDVFALLLLHYLRAASSDTANICSWRSQRTFSKRPLSSFSSPGILLGVELSLCASASLSGQRWILCLPFFSVHFLPKRRKVVPPTGTAEVAAGGPA